MRRVLLEVLAVGVAFAGGFFLARRRYRRAQVEAAGLLLPPPMNHDEYLKDRSFYVEMYKQNMHEYDRLVPWGAGGALVLSITLLRDLAGASVSAGPLLGLSWLLLLLSLASSITSHFTGSRSYSSAREALDLGQRQNAATDAATRQAIAEHRRSVAVSDRMTRWLNWLSGAGLIGGLTLLGIFAYVTLSSGGSTP